MKTTESAESRLKRRAIEEADLEATDRLFKVGFPERPSSYWRSCFARLQTRSVPEGYTRYGYFARTGSQRGRRYPHNLFTGAGQWHDGDALQSSPALPGVTCCGAAGGVSLSPMETCEGYAECASSGADYRGREPPHADDLAYTKEVFFD